MRPIDPTSSSPWRVLLPYALLIPLLFFAVHGYFSFEYARGGGGDVGAQWGSLASSSDTAQHKVELGCVFAFLTCLLLARWRDLLRNLPQIGIFIAMVLLAIASTLWSQDPTMSFRNGIYLAFNTLFALYLVRRFSPEQQMRLFIFLGTIAAFLSLLLVAVLPKYGIGSANGVLSWQGIYPQKNTLAQVTLFLLTSAFFAEIRGTFSKFSRIAYVLTLLMLILMSGSRTAWLGTGFLLAYAAVTKLLVKFQRRDAILITVGLLVVSAVILVGLAANWSAFLAMLGKNETLSGRIDIWKAVLLSIKKRPLLGYGYAAFWEGFRGESAKVVLAANWFVSYAHNGFLEVGLELGLVGIALVLWTLARAFRDAFRSLRPGCPSFVLWYVSIVILMLLYNVDEARFIFPNTIEWIMYVMASAALWQEAKNIRNKNIETAREELITI